MINGVMRPPTPYYSRKPYQRLNSDPQTYQLSHLEEASSASWAVSNPYAPQGSQAYLLPDKDVKSTSSRLKPPLISETEPPRSRIFRLRGWRLGVTLCTGAATAVLLLNIAWTIITSVKYGVNNGIGTMQRGSCSEARRLSLGLHVVINALSTALLSAR